MLREAGLEVEVGLLQPEAAMQMRSFLHWCHQRRPWVTVKVAVDAKGSVDDRSGAAGRFTSEAASMRSTASASAVMRFWSAQRPCSGTIHR